MLSMDHSSNAWAATNADHSLTTYSALYQWRTIVYNMMIGQFMGLPGLLNSANQSSQLPCSSGEKWTVEMLGNTIKFDHGYGRDSPAIGHFLRLLAALDSPDQRRFLRFVTGSPRLPPGGLAALQVPLRTPFCSILSVYVA